MSNDLASLRETEREWEAFVVHGREPNQVPTVIRASWKRCRGSYSIDPAIQKSPVSLCPESLARRRECAGALTAGGPLLVALGRRLTEAGHSLAVVDKEGYVLDVMGDPRVVEELAALNFRPGGNWSEAATGTNGPGTSLTERRPLQIWGAEHFVVHWHRWFCTAAPVFDPIAGDLLCAINITGYREEAHPHTLVAVSAVAAAVEQRLMAMRTVERQWLAESFEKATHGHLNDGVLAVDHTGRIIRMNAKAARLFGSGESPEAAPELQRALQEAIDGAAHNISTHTAEVYYQNIDRWIVTTISPVSFEQRPVGGVIILPERGRHEAVAPAPLDIHRTREHGFEAIVGGSTAIRRAISSAQKMASSDLPVLITGESGTGKELFAQAIHRASARAQGPFIAINCGSIPQELTESELFGYESGAFTGARRGGSTGRFEQAQGGTLFLDEIGELPGRAQSSLLRTLQNMEITRLGGGSTRRVDVRLIAATNRDLPALVGHHQFRADLYHRINVLTLEVPPLRERQSDIGILAGYFLEEFGPGRTFSSDAMALLKRCQWPGNVRQLRNVIARAAVMIDGQAIDARSLADLLEEHKGKPSEPNPGNPNNPDDVREALKRYGGNLTVTAARMGVSRMTLYRRLRSWGIARP